MRPDPSWSRPCQLSVEHGRLGGPSLLCHTWLAGGGHAGRIRLVVGTWFRQFWLLLPLVQVCPEFQFMIFGPKRSNDK